MMKKLRGAVGEVTVRSHLLEYLITKKNAEIKGIVIFKEHDTFSLSVTLVIGHVDEILLNFNQTHIIQRNVDLETLDLER